MLFRAATRIPYLLNKPAIACHRELQRSRILFEGRGSYGLADLYFQAHWQRSGASAFVKCKGATGEVYIRKGTSKRQPCLCNVSASLNPASIAAVRCTFRDVPGQVADLLADTLLGLGAQSTSVTEHRPQGAEEQKIFDDQQGFHEVWDRCVVAAHFPPEHNLQGTIMVVKSAMQLGNIETEITEIVDSEWVDGICASYQPTHIVGDLWIVPSWADPQDPAAINIFVEPGLAFGTGEHPTTRLCLKAIYSLGSLEGKHFLDYGTGSGVLALTALKKGASLAVGVDTDPLAVRAASQNGTMNSFNGRFVTLRCGPYLQDPNPLLASPQGFSLPLQYDVCVANILQGPLLELQPRLAECVKPRGTLVLSGILESQVSAIKQSYRASFDDFEVHSEDLWACMIAHKKET